MSKGGGWERLNVFKHLRWLRLRYHDCLGRKKKPDYIDVTFWSSLPVLDENRSVIYLKQTCNLGHFELRSSLFPAHPPLHIWTGTIDMRLVLARVYHWCRGRRSLNFLFYSVRTNWWIVAILNHSRFINFSNCPHVRWIWPLISM